MPRTQIPLNETELADLRNAMLVAEKSDPALFRSVGERINRDRNFTYLRTPGDPDRGYRAASPTDDFARRFLGLVARRGADFKKLGDAAFGVVIDRLIACHSRLGDEPMGLGSPFDALPERYREAISVSYASSLPDMRTVLRGWKIVFRVAFEDSGRIAREVVRFAERDGRFVYSWFFQRAGASGRQNRRENEGVVVPLRSSYLFTGFHDSRGPDEIRFRAAAIERIALEPIIDVQVGIAMSTNAEHRYPAATKFLWITIPDENVSDELKFLDRTVGFFGQAGDGLASLKKSFDGAKIDDDAVTLIWSYIDNHTEGTQLLSTPQGNFWTSRQVPLLLRQNWKEIVATYKDAAGGSRFSR